MNPGWRLRDVVGTNIFARHNFVRFFIYSHITNILSLSGTNTSHIAFKADRAILCGVFLWTGDGLARGRDGLVVQKVLA